MELLAPAGSWKALLAALGNGADAVYLGTPMFSARHYAANFDEKEMKQAIQLAHMNKKKVYITVNTLIEDDQFSQALDLVYRLYRQGADAIIVQDLGLAGAIRRVIPGCRLHASTQMSTHNREGIAYLREMGIRRAVLAREMTLDEIRELHAAYPDFEIEIFVHGAMCLSYSGLCLFSSMVGGRSGNQGRCAQPCRLKYQLFSRHPRQKMNFRNQGQHLLSPADLCLVDYLGSLREAGVHSLKIEGRMKGPEYVAAVTKSYRSALESLQEGKQDLSGEINRDLYGAFNRGFHHGYISGVPAGFLRPLRPNNRGQYMGRVIKSQAQDMVEIKLTEEIRPGDLLSIWVNRGKNPTIKVDRMFLAEKPVERAGPGDVIGIPGKQPVQAGDRVFRVFNQSIHDMTRLSLEKIQESSVIPVDAVVQLQHNRPMSLTLQDGAGHSVTEHTSSAALRAEKHPLTLEKLQEKIERMGDTPLRLRNLVLEGGQDLLVPYSEINAARRRACDRLLDQILYPPAGELLSPVEYEEQKKQVLAKKAVDKSGDKKLPLLTVAVSKPEQLHAAMESGADRIYYFLDGLGAGPGYQVEEELEMLDRHKKGEAEIIPAMPRIQKDRELEHLFDQILARGFPRIMVGNTGAVHRGRQTRLGLCLDYSLNIFNGHTLDLLSHPPVETVALSPELNFRQIAAFPHAPRLELVVHGEILLMLSQCCVIKELLGKGQELCAAPCRNSYFLKDEQGYEFPLENDAGCRSYIFNSRTLCLLEALPRIISLGIGSIRIEARRSSSREVRDTTAIYREVLRKMAEGDQVDFAGYKKKLADTAASPFTRGHYYRGVTS